jgi:DNA polymerase III epsilon subunit-like protein
LFAGTLAMLANQELIQRHSYPGFPVWAMDEINTISVTNDDMDDQFPAPEVEPLPNTVESGIGCPRVPPVHSEVASHPEQSPMSQPSEGDSSPLVSDQHMPPPEPVVQPVQSQPKRTRCCGWCRKSGHRNSGKKTCPDKLAGLPKVVDRKKRTPPARRLPRKKKKKVSQDRVVWNDVNCLLAGDFSSGVAFVIFDIEHTANGGMYRAHIIEFAAIVLHAKQENGRVSFTRVEKSEFCSSSSTKQSLGFHAPDACKKRFTRDVLDKAPSFKEVAMRFWEHVDRLRHELGVGSVVMAGHNIYRCDLPVMYRNHKRAGLDFFAKLRYANVTGFVDTLDLARKIPSFTDMRNKTLTDMYQRVTSKSMMDAHNALGDVNANAVVLCSKNYVDALSGTIDTLSRIGRLLSPTSEDIRWLEKQWEKKARKISLRRRG